MLNCPRFSGKSKTGFLSLVLLTFFFFILLTPQIEASHPFEVHNTGIYSIVDTSNGYKILPHFQPTVRKHHNYTINFFVINKTSGLELIGEDIGCEIFIFTHYGLQIYHTGVTWDGDVGYWSHEIPGYVFHYVNNYNYNLVCSDQLYSAHFVGLWKVDDYKPSNFIFIIIYGLIVFMILLSFKVDFKDELRFFVGIAFIVLGLLYIVFDFGVTNSIVIGMLVMFHWAIGILLMLKNIEIWLEGLEK